MKLYHYSKEFYDCLKTKRQQNVLTKEEIKQADELKEDDLLKKAYIDHISFFFDPIPLVLLPLLYKGQNDVWFKGNTLIEYTIESDTLESNVFYYVTETPNDLKEIDKIDDYKWDNDPNYSKLYFENKIKRKIKEHEIGSSLTELNKQINKYKGTTENNYLLASKRKDFDYNIRKYAASVPHVMIYPSKGIINYESTRKVVMGKESVST